MSTLQQQPANSNERCEDVKKRSKKSNRNSAGKLKQNRVRFTLGGNQRMKERRLCGTAALKESKKKERKLK